MKSLLLAPLCGAPLLFTAPAVELAFTPNEGDALTTTAERVLQLELAGTETTVTVDGEEQETSESPDLEMTLRETELLVFTDEYTEVGGDQVVELFRTFDEIGTTSYQSLTDPEGEEFELETPGVSALESTTVWFRWDEDDEEYSARFDEEIEDPDEELLEDLEAVADFSWFLPEDEVEEGDGWEIDIEAFRQLSSLSGDLKVVQEDDAPDDDFGDQFDENLEGELEGELTGFREENDRRLAVIRIEGEFTTRVEQEGELEFEDAEGSSFDRYEFAFELKGDLLWDVGAGCAYRFHFAGDVEMNVVSGQEISAEGTEIVLESTQEFEGTIEYEIEVE